MAKDLQSLLVSAATVAEDVLTEALDGLISIVDQTGEVLPVGGFGKLDIRTQITAYLLGARAAVVLGRRPTASVEATEIAENLHLDAQRVREALSRLKNSFVAKTGGGYEIPLVRMREACEEVHKKRRRA